MASRSLREITTTATGNGTGLPFALRCWAWFITELLGFTDYVESGSFKTFTKTGTNGSFTGSSFTFTDTVAGSFVSGDVNKWLVVKSTTIDRNCGIFKITGYTSGSVVTIDFRSGTTEFPTVDTGITWWVIDPTVTLTASNYFRCKTPHTQGWAVEMTMYLPTTDPYIGVRVSTNGAWDATGTIIGPVYFGSLALAVNWAYAEGDTSGEWINLFTHQATNNRYNGAIVSNLTVVYPKHDTEKVILLGNTSTVAGNYDCGNFGRTYDTAHIGHGYIWNNADLVQVDCWLTDFSYSTNANSWTKWTSRERNRRRSGGSAGGGTGDSLAVSAGVVTLTDSAAAFVTTDVGKRIKISGATNAVNNGSFIVTTYVSATQIKFDNAVAVNETSSFAWSMDQQDLLYGTVVVSDLANTAGRYEILGVIKGHYSVRGGAIGGWAVRKAFDRGGYFDLFHIQDGIAVGWGGVTAQH